ncbi:geranylgeranyl reductase family protein [Oscillatoria sp. CS-180]|nr:geranylgeranyl reductase family protein [Oscillatoria sp. CS-180]MDB9527078.1 geranylgeranyl reductase family protein [Oscillatoria sp. CS-180]
MTLYDCIIVGAGPSGGAAAYHLAKAGRSVLIVERETLPRYKPCGGGVSPQVAEWFDFDFSPAISVRVNRIRCTWKMADPVDAEVPKDEALWMVRRDEFDYFLVQQAQRQGAELWDGTKAKGIVFTGDRWRVETSHQPVEGQYLIAADGGRGVMARWLGFKQRRHLLAAAVEIEPRLTMPDNPLLYLEMGMVQHGYLWNFPKADGYSIGGGVMRVGEQRRQDLRPPIADYATHFDIEMAQQKAHGHPILAWDGDQPLHTQNALLAGEAACVVDPFTAEGIRPALFSGVKAAAAIDQALAGDVDALEGYTQVMQVEWGQDMRWAKRLAKVFYKAPKLAYRIGVKRPNAAPTIVKLFNGKAGYAEVAQRAINRLSGGLLKGVSR